MDEFAVEVLATVIGGVGVLATIVFGLIQYVVQRKTTSTANLEPELPAESINALDPAARKSRSTIRFIEW
jgi:hypothetical protein